MGYWRVPAHIEMFDYIKKNDINIAGIDPNNKALNMHKSAYATLFENNTIIAEEFYKTDSLFLEFKITKSNYYFKPKKNIEIERKIDSLRFVLINKYEKLKPHIEIFKSNTLKYYTLKKYLETNMLELTRTSTNKKKVNDFFITNERRDKYMAEYLKFIIDSLHPNTKVIVIAHNYHIEKKGLQSINNYRQQQFIDSCYFLGIFSSNFKNNHVANSKRFEKACMSASQNIYYVPFSYNIKLKKSYYNYTRNANMYDSYDGMIYIKNSKICKLIGYKKGLIRR